MLNNENKQVKKQLLQNNSQKMLFKTNKQR